MPLIREESFGVIPLKLDNNMWQVFLILHKFGNHWGFPKGRKNEGETPKESAVRELLEETGLQIAKFLQEMPFVESYEFRRKGKKIIKTVYYFPAVVEGNVQLQIEEVKEGKWVPLSDVSRYLTFKEPGNICQEILQSLK